MNQSDHKRDDKISFFNLGVIGHGMGYKDAQEQKWKMMNIKDIVKMQGHNDVSNTPNGWPFFYIIDQFCFPALCIMYVLLYSSVGFYSWYVLFISPGYPQVRNTNLFLCLKSFG